MKRYTTRQFTAGALPGSVSGGFLLRVTPGLIRGNLDDGGPAGNSRSSPVPAFDRTEYAIQIVLPTSGLSVVAWGVQQGQAARLAGAGAGAETLCLWLGCTEESKPSLLDTHTPGRSSDRSFLVHVRGSCVCPPPNNLQMRRCGSVSVDRRDRYNRRDNVDRAEQTCPGNVRGRRGTAGMPGTLGVSTG